MSGPKRQPKTDWWTDVKNQIGDAAESLREVEGVQVNHFQIGEDSRILIILKTDNLPPEQLHVLGKYLEAWFAPAKVATVNLSPGDDIDVKVFSLDTSHNKSLANALTGIGQAVAPTMISAAPGTGFHPPGTKCSVCDSPQHLAARCPLNP